MQSISDELEFLKAVMKAVSSLFGDSCEVVLHDYAKGYESTIVAIENGAVTGRKIGDCGSNLGLEVLRGTAKDGDRYNYVTQTKDGKVLRSSSVYIKNGAGEPIGCFCINFDVSDLLAAKKTIDTLSKVQDEHSEYFASNVNELLDFMIQESINMIGKPVSHMTREEKYNAISYLDEKGAFLITKSGSKICRFFNMSKFTMYGYLDEIRSRKQNPVSN